MKTLLKVHATWVILVCIGYVTSAQQTVQFSGLVNQGEGLAGWQANGTGPEPAGIGHMVSVPGFTNQYYYGSSYDYVSGNPNHAAFHLTAMTGFPHFQQALDSHGFTLGQIKCKYGLSSLGNDIEGEDWFLMNNWHYANYYHIDFVFELAGQPILSGQFEYGNIYINTLGGNFLVETGYSPLKNVATSSSPAFLVAEAFLMDLEGMEIRCKYEATFGQTFTGNGRTGAYYNILNGVLEVGYPSLPYKGLYANNQGIADWDADGSGIEPAGDGHNTQAYYCASIDYDNIHLHANASLGHFLPNSKGFFNTAVQLQYRGYQMNALKIKLGLSSLGPDVFGEDWGYQNGQHWCQYYNNHFILELNGEPIIAFMQDHIKLFSHSGYWTSDISVGKAYDISQNASVAAQKVALSFMRDLGSHTLIQKVHAASYVMTFSGNGRDGAIYQIDSAELIGVHGLGTFITPGLVGGIWTPQGSPYYIEGNVEVASGTILLIDPGVQVALRGPFHFTVQGTVKALGTETEKILFTRSNPMLFWGGFDYDFSPDTGDYSEFQYCIFEYSKAQGTFPYNSGGVFAIRGFDNIGIYQCLFRFNQALTSNSGYAAGGGAIALWDASPYIGHNVFHDNSSQLGGAIFCYDGSSPRIQRNLFYLNHSIYEGGAIELMGHCDPLIVNNTFSRNQANRGGAIDIYSFSEPVLNNNIFWDNKVTTGYQQISITSADCSPMITYCNIQGGTSGVWGYPVPVGNYMNNLNENPLFLDSLTFNFKLDSITPSPCIDAGDPASPSDPDGSPADMGCYYQTIHTGFSSWARPGFQAEIFPNPFVNILYVSLIMTKEARVATLLYDNKGALLSKTNHGRLPSGLNTLHHCTDDLPNGLYYMVIRVDDGILGRKIVKMP